MRPTSWSPLIRIEFILFWADLVRLCVRHSDPLTCAALVAMVLVTFGDVVFQNLNQAFAGIHTGVPNNDAQVLLYPFFDHFVDSLRESGHIDPWNPYIWGGTPAIGNPNVPFNILLYGLFHLSKPVFIAAMNWHLVVEFCLAATGMYLLSRKLGLEWWISLLASVLMIFSSSSAWLTNTYSIFFHWAVIPWVLWILLTTKGRTRFRSALYLGVIFYFQVTYGQAQMTLYSGLFFCLCLGWLLREKFEGWASFQTLVLGYVIGGCLAAHYVFPQIEFLLQSANREAMNWGATAFRYKVPFSYLMNLFIPRLFWSPVPWWPIWTDGWSSWEAFNNYIGLFFVLLSVYSLREFLPGGKRTEARRWKVLILALVVLNTTIWGGRILVGLNLGKSVPFSRLTHFLLYPLIYTSLNELPAIFRSRKELLRSVFLMGTALGGVLLLSRYFVPFALALFEQSASVSQRPLREVTAEAHRFLAFHRGGLSEALLATARTLAQWLCLLGLAWVWFDRPKLRNLCYGFVLIIAVGDTVFFFRDHRQTGVEPYPYYESLHPDTPILRALRDEHPDWENYRFATYTGRMEQDTALAPNLNALSRIPSLNGYSSFLTKRPDWELKVFRGNWGYVFPEFAVKLASVRFLLVGPETKEIPYRDRTRLVARSREYELLEYLGATPRYYFPRIIEWGRDVSYQSQRMKDRSFDPLAISFSSDLGKTGDRFQAPIGCDPKFRRVGGKSSEAEFLLDNPCGEARFFAFPKLDYSWWRFTLDGQEPLRYLLNGSHYAVEIPPGSHRLWIQCFPLVWYVGIAFSGLSVLVLLLTSFWLRRPEVNFFRWFRPAIDLAASH